MDRYPIEGYDGDDKYQITFRARTASEGLLAGLEKDQGYIDLILRHRSERTQLAAFHALEEARYLLRFRKGHRLCECGEIVEVHDA